MVFIRLHILRNVDISYLILIRYLLHRRPEEKGEVLLTNHLNQNH